MQSDLFDASQSPEFVHEPPKARPKRRVKYRGVEIEVDSLDDGRPNLNTLDPRIYGLQIPVSICRGDVRLAHLSDQEAEDWKRKHLPLKFIYTDHDFTPRGKVEMLRARGLGFTDIAVEFPDLADAAVQMAIEGAAPIA